MRVTLTETGQVRLTLRRPWRDGTLQLEFEPVAFLERLAVLVPRPHVNLLLYYGVEAPRAPWRSAIVPKAGGEACRSTSAPESYASEAKVPTSARGSRWAELLRGTVDIDVLSCPRCGGRLVLIALIEQPHVIARILGHLVLPSELPRPAPTRSRARGASDDLHWHDDVPVWTKLTWAAVTT